MESVATTRRLATFTPTGNSFAFREKFFEDDDGGGFVDLLLSITGSNTALAHALVGLDTRQPLSDRVDGDGDCGLQSLDEPVNPLGSVAGSAVGTDRDADDDRLSLELRDKLRDAFDSADVGEIPERSDTSGGDSEGVRNRDTRAAASVINSNGSHWGLASIAEAIGDLPQQL